MSDGTQTLSRPVATLGLAVGAIPTSRYGYRSGGEPLHDACVPVLSQVVARLFPQYIGSRRLQLRAGKPKPGSNLLPDVGCAASAGECNHYPGPAANN